MIGRWVAVREKAVTQYTRPEVRRQIEMVFEKAVLEILKPIELADLRVALLHGEEEGPPAIMVTCETVGQLDLGWIEISDAPIAWRAAAYKALEHSLGLALPVMCYHDVFEEIAMHYWEGATNDEAARQVLIDIYGEEASDLDEMSLPSQTDARRPEWMIEANAASTRTLPKGLRQKLDHMGEAHRALKSVRPEQNAWHLDWQMAEDYVPGIDECSYLPPLTLVPFEQFARELDDVARHGMEMGFMDIAGLCPLPNAARIDDWFASFRLGVEFLRTAQNLIQLDPRNL